jgi:hypothetical protein
MSVLGGAFVIWFMSGAPLGAVHAASSISR